MSEFRENILLLMQQIYKTVYTRLYIQDSIALSDEYQMNTRSFLNLCELMLKSQC